MTKLEYIRESHRQTNHKAWLALDGVYFRLKKKSIILAYLRKPIAWISYSVVWLISWLAFVVTLFSDVKYSIHFMEYDITEQGLDYADARTYLEKKQEEYKRKLSYGNYSKKQRDKIDHTFEYLFHKYHVAESEEGSQLTKIENITKESLSKIGTIAKKVEPVSEYAKIKLEKEYKEAAAEAKLQKEREK